jgi:hypothetical protein
MKTSPAACTTLRPHSRHAWCRDENGLNCMGPARSSREARARPVSCRGCDLGGHGTGPPARGERAGQRPGRPHVPGSVLAAPDPPEAGA